MKLQFICIFLSISIYPSATDLVPICLFYFIKTIHSYGRKKSNTRWCHFATTLLVYTNKRCLGYFCTSCCFCGCNLLSHYFVVLAFVRCIRVYILCVNGDSSSKLYSNELLERFFVLKIGPLFWRLFWRRFEGNKFLKVSMSLLSQKFCFISSRNGCNTSVTRFGKWQFFGLI